VTDLIGFINARLDEDEAAANEVHRPRSCGSVDRDGEFDPDPIWCSCDYPARALREIGAKRAIVRRCAARMNEMDAYPNGLVSPRALLARQALMDLAAAWNDHPDYREEWEWVPPEIVTGALLACATPDLE
jgi:hypothetical protein